MGEVIAVALQKGGVGKTTTVCSLGAALAKKGKKVLLIDMDSQGNVLFTFGVNPDKQEYSMWDVLTDNLPLKDAIVSVHKDAFSGVLDAVTSSDLLSGLDVQIIKHIKDFPKPFDLLKNALKTVRKNYDYIILDLPPALDIKTTNGLVAADSVLIPVQCEFYALRGVQKLIQTINEIKSEFNPKLKVLGMIPTMYITGTNIATVSIQEINRLGTENNIPVFETIIKRSVRHAEAPYLSGPSLMSRKSNDDEYVILAKEVFGV